MEDALALENSCKHDASLGRIIPTPQALSAGCGYAWRAGLQAEEEVMRLIEVNHLAYEKKIYLQMY